MMPTDLLTPMRSYKQRVFAEYLHQSLAVFGVMLLLFIVALALLGPYLSPYTYYSIDFAAKNQSPSLHHWFGTDDLGRDLLTRVCFGARISLFVGITAACIDMIIGVLWGATAALYGGKLDECMMRVVDILNAIPTLLLIIPLIAVIGSGLHSIVLALVIVGWLTMARIVRSQLMQIKQQGYVMASKGLGAGFWHILWRHLLPNASGTILVTMTMTIPAAIFTEAFLSYLGLGVQAPIASLGSMANDGLPALEYYPWRILFPAGLISLMILAFNLIAEGLQKSFDRAHGSAL